MFLNSWTLVCRTIWEVLECELVVGGMSLEGGFKVSKDYPISLSVSLSLFLFLVLLNENISSQVLF